MWYPNSESMICFLVDLSKYISYTSNLEQLDILNHKILTFKWLELGRKLKRFKVPNLNSFTDILLLIPCILVISAMSLISFLVNLPKYISYTSILGQLDILNHKILPFKWLELGWKLKRFRF
ncbi:hypothetical protein H5410_001472 [Solanum commersonii]|uniref:Uncharacterized protein n=1 Tax=Solanum commersonii TaxID=4109 RepID=A0A9J6AZS7_SOLCO|nr:hypothetical protein H5410_001472 [Solanum commersonii]